MLVKLRSTGISSSENVSYGSTAGYNSTRLALQNGSLYLSLRLRRGYTLGQRGMCPKRKPCLLPPSVTRNTV